MILSVANLIKKKAQDILEPAKSFDLLEDLADLEHKQWMEWAKGIMKSEDLSKARADRWRSLFIPYKDLSDEMKNADREYAQKVIDLIKARGVNL